MQSFVSYCAPSLRACAHIMRFSVLGLQFSEKGPEIGFSSLFSKNAKWLRLFHQTVLDENKGTLILLTIHFISKSSVQKSKFLKFGKKSPEIGLFRPK